MSGRGWWWLGGCSGAGGPGWRRWNAAGCSGTPVGGCGAGWSVGGGCGCRWFRIGSVGGSRMGSEPGSGDLGGTRYAGSAASVVNSSADLVNSDHGKRLTNPVLRVREFPRGVTAVLDRRDGGTSTGWGIIDGWPVIVSCRLGGGGSCRSWHCTAGPPRATSRW